MLELQKPQELLDHVNQSLGVSDWLEIDQAMIDAFGHATGDLQWIHMDVERAKREMPDGRTIAHGYLLVSLLPRLSPQVYMVRDKTRSVNYGMNKVRFTMPVQVGARVRISQSVLAADPIEGGVKLVMTTKMEIEGAGRPAMIAETVSLVYG